MDYNIFIKKINQIKTTKFGLIRFIIPKDFLDSLLNNFQADKELKNEILLNTKRNGLKRNLEKNKITLVVFEIMELIALNFNADYIIVVPYDNIKKEIDLEEIEIYPVNYIYKINYNYNKIQIVKGYINYKDFIIKNNNNYLGDSTNELLNEPKDIREREKEKEQEKDESKVIKRINKDSGEVSLHNSKLLEENVINQVNITDAKLSINKNNNNNDIMKREKSNNPNQKEKETEKSSENDTDELYNNEKIHNISQKYYKQLSFRNLNAQKISTFKNIKNKNEESKNTNESNINLKDDKKENEENISKNELINKYLFDDSKLTINLFSFEGESLKPIGLYNPSVYCFLICVLQVLLSIPELNFYFLSKLYLPKDKKNNMSKYARKENNTKICDAFHDFIQLYLLGRDAIEIPLELKRICIKLLGGMRMHDCQEFFVCFLEALQDELNTKEKYNIPENSSIQLRWITYRKSNNSFIDSIFTGLMRSTVQCKKCECKSFAYDPFIDLSVSINKSKNLEKCIKQYFENEKIDCEYKCDNCKKISKVSGYIFIINGHFRQ